MDCFEKYFPDERGRIYTAQNNLAATYWEMQDIKMAEKYLREAYEGRKNILQPDDPDYLLSLFNLAALENDLGHFDRAIDLMDTFHALANKMDDRSLVIHRAGSYNRLGTSYAGLGKMEEANINYQKAVDICGYDADCKNDLFYGAIPAFAGIELSKIGKCSDGKEVCFRQPLDLKAHCLDRIIFLTFTRQTPHWWTCCWIQVI